MELTLILYEFTLPHIYIYLKYGARLTSIQVIYLPVNLFYGLIVLYDEFLQYTDQDQKFLDPHHTITSGLEDP